MRPEERDSAYIWDILKAARLIQDFVADVDRDGFLNDAKTQSAVIAQLQIIGEATKRLSDGFRVDHPQVPWRRMAGMRDVLIHLYNRVRLDTVWTAAAESVPALIEQLSSLLPEETDPPT